MGSTGTNPRGVAACDFVTVSDCDQLVVVSTIAHGGTLGLLVTDVPFLEQIAVLATIGNSDHTTLSVVITMEQAVPNLYVSRNVFLKHQINLNIVCGGVHNLLWHNIWSAENPEEV